MLKEGGFSFDDRLIDFDEASRRRVFQRVGFTAMRASSGSPTGSAEGREGFRIPGYRSGW